VNARRPAWADEPLIVCVDGPLAGQWFTAEDWTERQTAAARMAERDQRRTAVSRYHATEASVAHPYVPDVVGAVWKARRVARDGVHLFHEGPVVHLTERERDELIAEGVVAVYAAPAAAGSAAAAAGPSRPPAVAGQEPDQHRDQDHAEDGWDW
jgi:hypothetical protein